MSDLAERIPTQPSPALTLVEGIRTALREAIVSGSLPPGYRLREIPLAAHFQCSTTPVREAIRKLEHEGLCKVYPRQGAEVTSFTLPDVEHLYEVRLVLETYATRKGAQRRPTEAELAPVREIVAQQEKSYASGDDAPPLDADFHQALIALAGNPVIAELVARATRQIEAVQARSNATVADGDKHALETHTAILDAVSRGDGDAAEQRMREHLEWASRAVLASIRESTEARTPAGGGTQVAF